MKTIGLISDTHGLLRPEVLDNLQGCGAILHGGDINKQIVLDQLNQIAPTYAVRGNADKEWAENIPVSLDLSLFGLHIFITHKKKDLPKDRSCFLFRYLLRHTRSLCQMKEKPYRALPPGTAAVSVFYRCVFYSYASLSVPY